MKKDFLYAVAVILIVFVLPSLLTKNRQQKDIEQVIRRS